VDGFVWCRDPTFVTLLRAVITFAFIKPIQVCCCGQRFPILKNDGINTGLFAFIGVIS
jgi:hypothetical protein